MSVIATICARGGSVGLPRKNIKPLHGKPLICYSIEQAQSCDFIDKIYVSTDDQEIANIAEKAGAIVPFIRPPALAQNETSKLDVIQHLVNELENKKQAVDVIIDLDVTSPLREVDDIRNCYAMLTPDIDLVITGYESLKNPYFNMVEADQNGYVQLSKKSTTIYTGRQSVPKVYAMNASIYVWHKASLAKGLWGNQKIKIYEMPHERSIDIDTPFDWKLVQLLMNENVTCKI
ncbi:MAG: acylneuraminate cytidylyltransferase family protein [Gammaproteobacteria bacterium]|jgi:CMP-N-acetylneuraminic acid synthetase|nr:acylneuraminate cytidylyltransferase family protein [Gammaproteobacteria bacterium]